ncbi:glycosyltransferase family 39 protein [Thiocapsa rosea]|uniref:Dolichyl-phosphate-mannose-protein mannosyltransferase n=1 Tax=Thiocapsa rosea TaxID=69360 RepID=A0A495VG33_9GAMM|nr:glycosyltransferase family 39 protein [Thiocapsa rosea]RKT47543.1 dolichyl-phosphate-mannose-protein mannosyltransferase [Thiocapsa rosea]
MSLSPVQARFWTLGVVILLMLVTGFRLIGLDHLPVWHDEVFTLVRVFGHPADLWEMLFSGRLLTPDEILVFQRPDPSKGWDETLRALVEHPEHAPLYYLVGRWAAMLPLDPVTALRGTSAAFGLLLPLAAFWLMRELFGRGPVPWVAAAVVAFSPLHLLYAQEARQYALWTLLVLASSAALQRALDRNRPRDWWLYGLMMALGLYSHLLFALMVPVHAAYIVLGAMQGSACRSRLRDLPVRSWLLAVIAAGVLFLPWIFALVSGFGDAVNHTQWMERAVGAQRNLLAWGGHITRAFLDVSPHADPPTLSLLLLAPIAVGLSLYLSRAPRPRMWLLVLIALVYLGVVLGPDLLLGGSRSQHVRYGLPAVLALQLMVAWGIGSALVRSDGIRVLAAAALALIMVFGALSQWRILQAETWWTKHFSASNPEVARLVNALDRPLVAVSPSGVAVGELVSLAYHLDDRVRIWGHGDPGAPVTLPGGFGSLVLLLPSAEFLAAIGPERVAEPIAGTWQWFLE